jgi:GNAT superfamily N-acetyltransferase
MRTLVPIEVGAVGFAALQDEARAEGYLFIDRLVEEWQSGANRFDKTGELFLGCLDGGVLVAVGGVQRDPYRTAVDVGRVRRVYVRPAWRGRGIGQELVTLLVERARGKFLRLRLRAENPAAARVYERIGFQPVTEEDATHALELKKAG